MNIVRDDTEIVLALAGELDLASAHHLREAFGRASRLGAEQIVLDLDRLEFMDASGLHVIDEAAAKLRDRLRVRPGAYRHLFRVGGLDRRLRFEARSPASPAHEVAIRNIGYVRALYSVWHAEGLDAMVELVPQDVNWQPSEAEGRVLKGTGELLEFWGPGEPTPAATAAWFTAVGEDVIIETAHRIQHGAVRRVYSLYEFRDQRLIKATAVPAG